MPSTDRTRTEGLAEVLKTEKYAIFLHRALTAGDKLAFTAEGIWQRVTSGGQTVRPNSR